MPNIKDELIFVCGAVNNAVSAGKILKPEEIRPWLQGAQDAFRQTYGEPSEETHRAPPPQPQSVGPMQHAGHVAQQVLSAINNGVSPETKPFTQWGGDKAYLGWKDKMFEGMPEPDVCWGVWQQAAAGGDAHARSLLEKAAAADPTKGDPKWHDANKRRISRAKAILAML